MSDFATVLQEMVERVPGAVGAIFADWEGESVSQFAFDLPDIEIQIVGAQWGVVWSALGQALTRAGMGSPDEMLIDAEHGSVLVRKVTEGYYVVLSLRRGTHLATALRELARSVESLRAGM